MVNREGRTAMFLRVRNASAEELLAWWNGENE